MPMAQLHTTWSREEFFNQAISMVSDDSHWLIQSQSDQSLVLRRPRAIDLWKWIVFGLVVIFTLGLGLILFPALFIGFSNQQIAITAKESEGHTNATMTYTSGARRRVTELISAAPRP